ncbi:hypothetical protein SOVF_011140, partial [Spinacia oleracea]
VHSYSLLLLSRIPQLHSCRPPPSCATSLPRSSSLTLHLKMAAASSSFIA